MIKSSLKPIGSRVIIEPQEADLVTASGIYIPDSAQKNQFQGTVVAVGSDETIQVKKGDKVLYSQNSGTQIAVENTNLIIIEYADLLVVI